MHVANVGLNGWCASLEHKLVDQPKCFSMLRLDPIFEKVGEEQGGLCSSLWKLPIEYVDLFTSGSDSPSCFKGPYAAQFVSEENDYQILEIYQIHPRSLDSNPTPL